MGLKRPIGRFHHHPTSVTLSFVGTLLKLIVEGGAWLLLVGAVVWILSHTHPGLAFGSPTTQTGLFATLAAAGPILGITWCWSSVDPYN